MENNVKEQNWKQLKACKNIMKKKKRAEEQQNWYEI